MRSPFASRPKPNPTAAFLGKSLLDRTAPSRLLNNGFPSKRRRRANQTLRFSKVRSSSKPSHARDGAIMRGLERWGIDLL